MSKRQSMPAIGPVEFIDRIIKREEKGERFTLAAYQRRVLQMALRRDPSGAIDFSATNRFPACRLRSLAS